MPSLTITNARDRARIFPTSSIAGRMMLEDEGFVMEKVTGPLANAAVELSSPAVAILHVQAYVTASGVWAAVPNLTEGVGYSVALSNNNGVAALTELLGASQAANTWIVMYQRSKPDATPGNQSVAIAGSGV